MKIDRIGQLGILLRSRTGAAPERIKRSAESFVEARPQRDVVRQHAKAVLSAQPNVEQQALVVVEQLRVGLLTEDATSVSSCCSCSSIPLPIRPARTRSHRERA